MIESSEEAQEEENFRGDEKDYAVAKAFLNGRGVVALECPFSYNVSSSLIHG